MDDRELNQLLREWKAPDAPPHLRPRRAHTSRVRWLVTGTIRVPVPIAIAALLLMGFLFASMRPGSAPASDSARPRRSGELARFALTGPLQGFDAVLVEVNFAPGASAGQHRHPGFILGYVVDGQMRFGINNEAERIVPAGGTFYEPHGSVHTTFGAARPDTPVRALVFLVVPTGSPLTGPA